MKLGMKFSGKAPILAAAMVGTAAFATGCGSTAAAPATNGGGGTSSGAATPQTAAAGKDITNFDACSVVSDSEYVQAITAESSDPSALGTVHATHAVVDGTNTGLPGAKACQLSYTTTDSDGRVNQGGDPVIVTFDVYSNLRELQGNDPVATADYASAGAQAWEGPGDAGVPHITKDGYLFRMSGNSDTKLLKAIALGIAGRL
jgi:hypothetical protein